MFLLVPSLINSKKNNSTSSVFILSETESSESIQDSWQIHPFRNHWGWQSPQLQRRAKLMPSFRFISSKIPPVVQLWARKCTQGRRSNCFFVKTKTIAIPLETIRNSFSICKYLIYHLTLNILLIVVVFRTNMNRHSQPQDTRSPTVPSALAYLSFHLRSAQLRWGTKSNNKNTW